MSHPPAAESDPPRPVTFARVFRHFALGGLGASVVGLVLVPRLLVRWKVSEARISGISFSVWIALLVLAFAPLARALVREWTTPP